MYVLNIQNKKDLQEEVRELKQKVALLENNVYTFNENELDEAKAQWAYYKELYQKEKSDKQNRIRKCFRWIQQIKPSADWEEFRDWVMSDEEQFYYLIILEMKFIVDRASDSYKVKPKEVEMNTLEELIEFIKEN